MSAPEAIPNLALRFRASDITGLANLDPVASWPEGSGTGLSATQGTTLDQPEYRAAIFNDNTLPGVYFNNDWMEVLGVTLPVAEFTVFAVMRPTSSTSARTIFQSGAGAGTFLVRTEALKPEVLKTNTAVLLSGTTNMTINADALVTSTYSDAANAVATFLNGAANGSGTTAQSITSAATPKLGVNNAGSNTSTLAGVVAEILVYSRVLTTTERAHVHSYVQDTYGVTVSDYDASWDVADATVIAGTDQSVQVDSGTVTLTATGDPAGGTYSWAQTGAAVTLSSTTAAAPTFTAPSTAGATTFTVTYTPTAGDPVADSVTVTYVNPTPPTTSHTKANIVEVDATASSAPTTLVQASGATVTITEPTTDVYRVELPASFETNIVLTLTATDAYAQATQQTVTITPAGGTTVVGGPKVKVGGVYV